MRLPVLVLMLSGTSILTACQTTTPTGGTEVCREWRVWRYSSQDTVETQKQAVGNNAARADYGCK